MGGLPRRVDFALAGRRLARGSWRGNTDSTNSSFASTDAAVKRSEIAAAGSDGVIAGHCGVPFTDIVDGKLWHNSGALGLPANDGTPRVCGIDPDAGGRRHRGDARTHWSMTMTRAAAKMRARGYPVEYADSLRSGLWPSCDILPPEERRQRGQRLRPALRYRWSTP